MTDWVARWRQAVELLADVPFAEGWKVSQLWAVLESIEAGSAGAGSAARLGPADALALLGDAFSGRGVRPAFGSGALDAVTGLPLPQNNEYDFDLMYQVAAKDAPEWLKPLQLRGRMAHVDQWSNRTYAQINEYRLILNYEVNFKGFRR